MVDDIFQLRDVKVVADGTRLPLRSFRNGARRPPEPGSLLIWNEGGDFDVTGHVAVVTEVLDGLVRFVEQNVEDKVWPAGQGFSRELRLTVDTEGRYWIDSTAADAGIMGWVIQTAASISGPWTQQSATTPATVPIGTENAFLRAARP